MNHMNHWNAGNAALCGDADGHIGGVVNCPQCLAILEDKNRLSARSLLVWFQVDVPAEWGEDESWAMLDYADDHERVSLSRLAVLENLWHRLYGPKGA